MAWSKGHGILLCLLTPIFRVLGRFFGPLINRLINIWRTIFIWIIYNKSLPQQKMKTLRRSNKKPLEIKEGRFAKCTKHVSVPKCITTSLLMLTAYVTYSHTWTYRSFTFRNFKKYLYIVHYSGGNTSRPFPYYTLDNHMSKFWQLRLLKNFFFICLSVVEWV